MSEPNPGKVGGRDTTGSRRDDAFATLFSFFRSFPFRETVC